MVPACKLMEIVMQNCRGKVDSQVGPYLDLAIGRLQKAEHKKLKDFCMEVRSVCSPQHHWSAKWQVM